MEGRRIEVIREDTEGKPDVGITKVRKLVERDRVHLLSGFLNSAVAYAAVDYIVQHELPTVITNAGADGLTQEKRNPYLFRVSFANSQGSHPLGEWVQRKLGYKKIVTLGAGYVAGYEHVRAFQRTFRDAGGEIIQELWPPLGTYDFAPYVTQVRRDADAVFAFFFGSDAIRFVRQYREYGLKDRLPLLGKDLTDEIVLNQIADDGLGVITAGHYSAALETPANKAFVSAFKQAYGHEPTLYAESGYTGAKVISIALQVIKGKVEDKEAFLRALRGVSFEDAPRGPFRFDAYQNVIFTLYIRKVEKKDSRYQNTVIDAIPNVGQFWKWTPEEYLRTTHYSR